MMGPSTKFVLGLFALAVVPVHGDYVSVTCDPNSPTGNCNCNTACATIYGSKWTAAAATSPPTVFSCCTPKSYQCYCCEKMSPSILQSAGPYATDCTSPSLGAGSACPCNCHPVQVRTEAKTCAAPSKDATRILQNLNITATVLNPQLLDFSSFREL